MSWQNKEVFTGFDTTPIEGLCFRDGTMLHSGWRWPELQHMKSPCIAFPSGEILELSDANDPQISLYNRVDLPLYDTRDQAYNRLMLIADESWCSVFKVKENQMELWHHNSETIFLVTYDNEHGIVADIQGWAA